MVKNLNNEANSFSIRLKAGGLDKRRIKDDHVYVHDLGGGQSQTLEHLNLCQAMRRMRRRPQFSGLSKHL